MKKIQMLASTLVFCTALFIGNQAQAGITSKSCMQKRTSKGTYKFNTHGTIISAVGYARAANARRKWCRSLGQFTSFSYSKFKRSTFKFGKRDWFKIRYTCKYKKRTCTSVKGNYKYSVPTVKIFLQNCIKGRSNHDTCVKWYLKHRYMPAVKKQCIKFTGHTPKSILILNSSKKLSYIKIIQGGGYSGPKTSQAWAVSKIYAAYICKY